MTKANKMRKDGYYAVWTNNHGRILVQCKGESEKHYHVRDLVDRLDILVHKKEIGHIEEIQTDRNYYNGVLSHD